MFNIMNNHIIDLHQDGERCSGWQICLTLIANVSTFSLEFKRLRKPILIKEKQIKIEFHQTCAIITPQIETPNEFFFTTLVDMLIDPIGAMSYIINLRFAKY